MFSIGMRLTIAALLVSIAGAQRVQLHNCAKMILITGKFWPCIVWQRPNATSTTSTSTASAPMISSTESVPSRTTDESTSSEETTMEMTTERTTSTRITPSTRRSKTTKKVKMTTVEESDESTTDLPSTTTVIPPSTARIVETTTTEHVPIPTTESEVITTEIRVRRIKPVTPSTIPSTTTTTTTQSTTTEEKTTEGTTKITTTAIPSTTTDVEIQVVTKPQKKEETSTSESIEEEEVTQSTTPPPYFVTLLTDRSRDEFYRIAKNPFLTKAELLYRIRRWASKQPKLVREAIFDIEHELIRQQSSVRKEAASILEALPLAFQQYTNIRDNVALTKQEEEDDLEALYKALPRKSSRVLRYVLMMAGDSYDTARMEENKLRQFSVQSFRSTIRDTLG